MRCTRPARVHIFSVFAPPARHRHSSSSSSSLRCVSPPHGAARTCRLSTNNRQFIVARARCTSNIATAWQLRGNLYNLPAKQQQQQQNGTYLPELTQPTGRESVGRLVGQQQRAECGQQQEYETPIPQTHNILDPVGAKLQQPAPAKCKPHDMQHSLYCTMYNMVAEKLVQTRGRTMFWTFPAKFPECNVARGHIARRANRFD